MLENGQLLNHCGEDLRCPIEQYGVALVILQSVFQCWERGGGRLGGGGGGGGEDRKVDSSDTTTLLYHIFSLFLQRVRLPQ